MSIIVWDGQTLAADNQGTHCGLRFYVKKLYRLDDGTLLAFVGGASEGLNLIDWYKRGADPKEWPETQKSEEDMATLIIVTPQGVAACYEKCPVPIPIEKVPHAWGSGRDFALGALAMGADARKAVEIASVYAEGCGQGITAVDMKPRRRSKK